MSDGGYKNADAARAARYDVVGGHNTWCASLLGSQGCDCRSPWDDEPADSLLPYFSPEDGRDEWSM